MLRWMHERRAAIFNGGIFFFGTRFLKEENQ